VYIVHISVYIILSVLVDRSHLDMEVSAEKKHDRHVGVPADCAIKLSFSASVLIASSKSLAWFLSSKRERRKDMLEREGVLSLVNKEIGKYCMTFETSCMKVSRFVEK